MDIQIKITDKNGNIQQYNFKEEILTDAEIEKFAKDTFSEPNHISDRLINCCIIGATWARNKMIARTKSNS